jgi:glutathione synthase/RimK-type ligase-like ATP-grasp enzyme
MIDVAIVTSRELPEPDVDEPLLLEALRARGIDAVMHAWDAGPLQNARIAVIRSTWNYYRAHDAFLAWVAAAKSAAPLYNSHAIIEWNTDKAYLGDLERAGVRTVPTAFVERGSSEELASLMDARGWKDVVVKPRVSAGSFETTRHRRDEVKGGELRRAASERHVMVQPYVKAVEDRGERSHVFIDGEITHAVRKSPRFAGGVERVDPVPLDDADVAFAKAALEVARARAPELLYGRVDIARDEHDRPMLMELELVEPSLFFVHAPHALERFSRAIERIVRALP